MPRHPRSGRRCGICGDSQLTGSSIVRARWSCGDRNHGCPSYCACCVRVCEGCLCPCQQEKAKAFGLLKALWGGQHRRLSICASAHRCRVTGDAICKRSEFWGLGVEFKNLRARSSKICFPPRARSTFSYNLQKNKEKSWQEGSKMVILIRKYETCYVKYIG